MDTQRFKQRWTLALSAALVFGASALAQAPDNSAAPPPPQQQQQGAPGPGARGMDPARQLNRLARRLNLSGDQRAAIKPILEERQQKMTAIFQNQSLTQGDARAQMRAVHEDTHSRIMAVLNDQQKQQFEQMERMRRNRMNNPPPSPPDGSQTQ
jgi:Spy/CpxP family protein refolding chaperone